MAELSSLDFTDLYVRLDDRIESRYSPTPRQGQPMGCIPVPVEFDEQIDLLRSIIRKQPGSDFSVNISNMRLRVSKQNVLGGEQWVALRRFPLDLPELDRLNFRPDVLQAFRSWGRRTGLVVIGGATRAGKTTTAVALLNDWLRTHGRVAITIEDPIEYQMQGEIGDRGYCFQREVHEDSEWGEAVKTALRWAPRYIFLGEVRTPKAARNLLRAATSGHLALCTVHGGSVEETLSALVQIVQTELGETAWSLLADGLCAVVHQSLAQGRPNIYALQTDPNNAADPVRAAIRNRKLQLLGTEITKQEILRSKSSEGEGSSGQGGTAGQGGSTNRAAAQAAAAKRGWFGSR